MIESHKLGRYTVRVWTHGEGRPLLYLHGYEHHPGDAPFLRRLGQSRRVIAPEHPGYGASEGFDALQDITDLVLFYRELLGTFGVGRVDIVGHCFGGMIAAELAAFCPELVERLVLVNAYGLWLDGVDTADPFSLSPERLRQAKWHDPQNSPVPEPSLAVADPSDRIAATIERSQNLAVAAKFMWPLPDRGLRRRLHLIKAPTLVIHGTSDGLLPVAHADEFVRLIPNAEYLPVDRAGHLPIIEREEEVCAAIVNFCSAPERADHEV